RAPESGSASGLDVRGLERQRAQHSRRLRPSDRRTDLHQRPDLGAPRDVGAHQGALPVAGRETFMRLRISLIGVLLLLLAVPVARAGGPSIDWDPAYTWEPGASVSNSPSGGEFKLVGTVSAFDVPFQFLNAGDP